MKKALALVVCFLMVACIVTWAAQPAMAIKAFSDEFKAKYVDEDSSDATAQALAEAVDRVKCNVCHAGRSKSTRNAYGQQLEKLLDRKVDKDDVEKIQKALDDVGKIKSGDSADSPTFGELIASGKLPANDS